MKKIPVVLVSSIPDKNAANERLSLLKTLHNNGYPTLVLSQSLSDTSYFDKKASKFAGFLPWVEHPGQIENTKNFTGPQHNSSWVRNTYPTPKLAYENNFNGGAFIELGEGRALMSQKTVPSQFAKMFAGMVKNAKNPPEVEQILAYYPNIGFVPGSTEFVKGNGGVEIADQYDPIKINHDIDLSLGFHQKTQTLLYCPMYDFDNDFEVVKSLRENKSLEIENFVEVPLSDITSHPTNFLELPDGKLLITKDAPRTIERMQNAGADVIEGPSVKYNLELRGSIRCFTHLLYMDEARYLELSAPQEAYK